jgi:hypothetical protein
MVGTISSIMGIALELGQTPVEHQAQRISIVEWVDLVIATGLQEVEAVERIIPIRRTDPLWSSVEVEGARVGGSHMVVVLHTTFLAEMAAG